MLCATDGKFQCIVKTFPRAFFANLYSVIRLILVHQRPNQGRYTTYRRLVRGGQSVSAYATAIPTRPLPPSLPWPGQSLPSFSLLCLLYLLTYPSLVSLQDLKTASRMREEKIWKQMKKEKKSRENSLSSKGGTGGKDESGAIGMRAFIS